MRIYILRNQFKSNLHVHCTLNYVNCHCKLGHNEHLLHLHLHYIYIEQECVSWGKLVSVAFKSMSSSGDNEMNTDKNHW